MYKLYMIIYTRKKTVPNRGTNIVQFYTMTTLSYTANKMAPYFLKYFSVVQALLADTFRSFIS